MDTLEESAGRILDCMAQAGRNQQRHTQFVVGRVLAAGEDALRLSANGQELTAEDLWVSETLPPLVTGDRVALLTEDCQSYYLICKVVRP